MYSASSQERTACELDSDQGRQTDLYLYTDSYIYLNSSSPSVQLCTNVQSDANSLAQTYPTRDWMTQGLALLGVANKLTALIILRMNGSLKD